MRSVFILILIERSTEKRALGTWLLGLLSQCRLAKYRIAQLPRNTAAHRILTNKCVLEVSTAKNIWLVKDAKSVTILQKISLEETSCRTSLYIFLWSYFFKIRGRKTWKEIAVNRKLMSDREDPPNGKKLSFVLLPSIPKWTFWEWGMQSSKTFVKILGELLRAGASQWLCRGSPLCHLTTSVLPQSWLRELPRRETFSVEGKECDGWGSSHFAASSKTPTHVLSCGSP